MLRGQLAPLAVGALLLVGARQASACSIAAHTPLTIAHPGTGVAPGALATLTVSTKRGTGPSGGCERTVSSCDDLGMINLSFVAPQDPDSALDAIGYRLSLVAGELPVGLALPEHPVVAFADSKDPQRRHLHLVWIDGGSDKQEAIDFTVVIAAVDSNGNQGPPSDLVPIRSGGTRGCGLCGSAPPGQAPGAAFGALLALTWARRRGRVRLAVR
ncbi:MAG TPA: hypothetical protein VER33_28130 [Polyangiaceae bacterium]|nr:hypothetical protein [Polyangiaceae bacterium]